MSRGNAAATAALLVVAACGFPRPADVPGDGTGSGGSDAPEVPLTPTCTDASGSRIKLTVRQASDGAKQVIGLYDTARAESCRWAKAGDGQLRCMPVSNVGQSYSDGYVAYSAAGCATPILGIFSNRTYAGRPFLGRDGADVFGTGSLNGCEGVLRVFAVGALLPDPATVWVKDPNGACAAITADNFFYNYYAAGAETPPSTFAAGTKSKDGTARVWLETITGADGSHSCGDSWGLRDSAFGDAACNAANYAYDETRRCVPSGFSSETLFTDSGCATSTTAARRPNCRPPAAYANQFATTARCGYGSYRVRAMGAATAALFDKDSNNVCRAVPPTYTTYSVDGAYIPEAMFPEVTYAFAPSGSRLMRRDLVTGGARVPTGELRDTQLDMTCKFEPGADGVQRCTPGFGTEDEPVADASDQIFTNATCSGTPGSYAVVYPPSTSCAQPAAPRYARIRDPNTGYNTYARLGNAASGTFFSRFPGSSTCTQIQGTATVYQLGASITSELVTATEVRL